LAARGTGEIPPEQREELKTQLLRELASRPGVRLGDATAQELQRFLDAGRISESNLDRLERRVLARCGAGGGGAQSARSEACSEFSRAAASEAQSCRSARLRGSGGAHATSGAATLPAVQEELHRLPQGPIQKWSEVAKYWKAREEVDKVVDRETTRTKQHQMAYDLKEQIEIKKHLQKASEDAEMSHAKQQVAEIERWKAAETEKEESARRRARAENKDRLEQNKQNQKQRDLDLKTKLQQDFEQVDRAAKDIERERQNLAARKANSKAHQMGIMLESKEHKGNPKEAKMIRYEEERRQVDEFHQMLADQVQRNKPTIGEIRGVNAVILGPPTARKGQEYYTEENVMKQLNAANDVIDKKERDKIDTLKTERQQNQDFLFQQIAERNRNRERALDQKRNQKMAAQAATQEYHDVERRRVEEMRTKNVSHRLDLEQQILDRQRKNAQPKGAEDKMSPAEKAINQHLIQEAEDLKMEHMSPRAMAH